MSSSVSLKVLCGPNSILQDLIADTEYVAFYPSLDDSIVLVGFLGKQLVITQIQEPENAEVKLLCVIFILIVSSLIKLILWNNAGDHIESEYYFI